MLNKKSLLNSFNRVSLSTMFEIELHFPRHNLWQLIASDLLRFYFVSIVFSSAFATAWSLRSLLCIVRSIAATACAIVFSDIMAWEIFMFVIYQRITFGNSDFKEKLSKIVTDSKSLLLLDVRILLYQIGIRFSKKNTIMNDRSRNSLLNPITINIHSL